MNVIVVHSIKNKQHKYANKKTLFFVAIGITDCVVDFLCIWSPVFKTKCNPEQPGGDKATGDGDNDDEQRNDR